MSSSKPYHCQRCPRAFARLEHLQRHDRSHTKEKPYVCVQCPKAFTRKCVINLFPLPFFLDPKSFGPPHLVDLLARHERLSHAPEGSSTAGDMTQTPPSAHPNLDGLDTLASVVTDHAQMSRSMLSNSSPHFPGGPSTHPTPMAGVRLANPETPSAAPPTPLPGPDFGYAFGGFTGPYEGNDFTSFLDSVPLPSHPFSPAFQPLPLFPSLAYSPVTDFDQSSDRGQTSETTSTPSSSVLPRHGAQLPSLQPEGYQTTPKARQPTGFVPVTAQCRDRTLESLKEYAGVVPDPSLPSRHALSRCLTGYLMGFHDHYPIVHKPTLNVDTMSLPLFLSMAALGARYSREPDTSMRLYQIAKPVTLERFRRVFLSGTMPTVNVANDQATLELLQALLLLISVSSWFINNPPYHESLAIRSYMATLLRKDGINRLPEFDGTWTSWVRRECVKRTKLIVCCFFNIHTIVFDIPPVILTEELSLDLPARKRSGRHRGLTSGKRLVHRVPDIWLMTKAGRLSHARGYRQTLSTVPTPEIISMEQALERWCQCWERNQESSIDPLSPHGPVSFTSAALVRLAYIRLNADCGSARQLQTWDPVQIATSLKDNLRVQRGDRLTRAALHCAHALSTPVKLGIGFVAHSQVALWSNQHALCSLECAVLLAKWLEAVTVPEPSPSLTEQEIRLRDFVLEMVMEVQHGIPREWLLANNTRLSAAVTRLWARLFTADYIWEMVSLIGRSLNSYADLLDQQG
ncbi:hypothetical protein POX_a01321 [Penicillium oxalicum]|uniref:hypothetical protein n=1 Tax=Penicillium oxalicum TaxID=69781 RepID=UPI0020B6D5D3|nr:hypothetical protein POX_a01321 [Penicillium oxalicum]KAI2794720.1 hypothetical protein POX_a01321 [Penicillium oxalicum]